MAGREKDQETGGKEKILVLIVPAVNRISFFFGCVLILFGLGGCSSHVPYETLDQNLSRGDCRAAAELLAEHESDYGDNGELLFLLDSAMTHMACREFGLAQEKFRAAEDLAENLWTLSLSREAASYLTNEYVQSYGGEDFERAMIHLMSALAFLDEGRPEEALVACRRLDSLLALFNDTYEQENVYKEDAFGRYLSGILREADHDPDGAFIDYKKALAAYGDRGGDAGTALPRGLKADLFRVAGKAGRLADAGAAVPEYTAPPESGDRAPTGQVVWIGLAGRVPGKREKRITVPSPQGLLTIAFAGYDSLPRPAPGPTLVLRSESGEVAQKTADLVSDISAIAVKSLEDRRVRTTAKAIARAAAKQVLIRQIAKNDDKKKERAIENLLNMVNLFVEKADLRSWRSLPGRIYMARFFLPPGEWRLDTLQTTGTHQKKLLVKAGEIRYIVVNHSWGGQF